VSYGLKENEDNLCIYVRSDLRSCTTSLVTYYTQVGSVLIGGDLNGQFKQGALRETGNMKSNLITDFIIRNNLFSLQSVYGRHNEYTFKTTQGVLDYFLVDGQCLNYV